MASCPLQSGSHTTLSCPHLPLVPAAIDAWCPGNIPTPTNMWFRQARLVGWKSMHLGDLQREEAPDPTTPPSEMAQSPMSDGFGYVFEIVPLGPNTLSLRYPDDRIAMNHYTDGKEGSLALQSPGDLDLWMRLDRA